MTELRNRPGEILDRVADKSEAFIIERSGRRKACLVPLSVFFPDISPDRIAHELKTLEDHGEQPRTTITDDRELAFSFPQMLSGERSLEITVVLPHGYPNNCPRVYANGINDAPPHRWADGALCLFGIVSAWNPGKHTVHTTLTLARQWLSHYSAWRQTGQWLDQEGRTNDG